MNVIIEWNNVFLETIREIGGAPCPIARAGAMMHIAMYDVINIFEPTPTYQSYLSGLPTAVPGTLAEAAAVFAAHQVLCKVYPNQINEFDSALNASLEQLGAVPGRSEEMLGRAVADLIIAQRTGDGSELPPRYQLGNNPGDWRPTGRRSCYAAMACCQTFQHPPW